jgi:hypothetical protein
MCFRRFWLLPKIVTHVFRHSVRVLSKEVCDNLVKFVYKLGKNCWIRAWCSNDSWAIFTKNLQITIDRKLYWIVHFYHDFLSFELADLLINLRIVIQNLVVVFIRKNCIREVFFSILLEEFLPCPVHPA